MFNNKNTKHSYKIIYINNVLTGTYQAVKYFHFFALNDMGGEGEKYQEIRYTNLHYSKPLGVMKWQTNEKQREDLERLSLVGRNERWELRRTKPSG